MPTNGTPPVCPVSRSQTPPAMPAVRYPAVPKVTDLPSAIAALNQLALILPFLTGNPAGGQRNGLPSPDLVGPPQRWKETLRNVETARVSDPNDGNNWVPVPRLTKIGYYDKISDDTLKWTLG